MPIRVSKNGPPFRFNCRDEGPNSVSLRLTVNRSYVHSAPTTVRYFGEAVSRSDIAVALSSSLRSQLRGRCVDARHFRFVVVRRERPVDMAPACSRKGDVTARSAPRVRVSSPFAKIAMPVDVTVGSRMLPFAPIAATTAGELTGTARPAERAATDDTVLNLDLISVESQGQSVDRTQHDAQAVIRQNLPAAAAPSPAAAPPVNSAVTERWPMTATRSSPNRTPPRASGREIPC